MSVPRNALTRTLALAAAVCLSLPALTACSNDAESPEPQVQATPASIKVGPTTKVVDVRTPEEFEAGHLTGAVNINVESPDFDAQVNALDPAVPYVVYCRSGSRSAAATARMRDLGLDGVTDAGGLDAAAAGTGLAVTR